MSYFGLDVASRVVVGLAPLPRSGGDDGATEKAEGKPFHYDFSLERLILAEGKLEDASVGMMGVRQKQTEKQTEKHELCGCDTSEH